MTAVETAERMVRGLEGWATAEIELRPGVVPMASPMNQGVDAAAFRVTDRATGKSVWVKIPDADAALFADPATVVAAASAASAAGIGPAVLAADAATGAMVMADLSTTHRVATLNRLAEPAVRDAVLAARKAFHAGPTLPRTEGVFEAIEALLVTAGKAGTNLPPDHAWLIDNVRAAAAAIRAAGVDTRAGAWRRQCEQRDGVGYWQRSAGRLRPCGQ